jgi:prepilin-type N-terminal cleavage/methylation domain-containing protein
MRGKKALSLIELVISMAIVGVVGLLIVYVVRYIRAL